MQIQRDALVILRQLPRWELSAARWKGVREILDALEAGLDLADDEMVTGAIFRLGEAGPVRIIKVGTTSGEPPPPLVRERVNELISRLSGSVEDEA
jgi:hypothetical protein